MTTAANIRRDGGGMGMFQRTDPVFKMASRARRRIKRPFRHRFAVNAHRPFARLLIMARAACLRLPGKINRRGRRLVRDDLVGVVAILTRRRIVVTGLEGETVNARIETFRLPFVADRTIHPQHRFVVIGMFRRDVGMTTDAGIRFVRRQLEFCKIYKQGNGSAGRIRLGEGTVPVAIQTIAILDTGERRKSRQRNQRKNRKPNALHALHFRY